MDGPHKVTRSLVVARGNPSIVLEAGEEVFHQVACLVEVTVIFALALVRHPRENHHGLSLAQQWLNEPGRGVVGFVCNAGLRRRVFEQDVSALQIMAVAERGMRTRGVAQCVHWWHGSWCSSRLGCVRWPGWLMGGSPQGQDQKRDYFVVEALLVGSLLLKKLILREDRHKTKIQRRNRVSGLIDPSRGST